MIQIDEVRRINEMANSEDRSKNTLVEVLEKVVTPENIQKYIFGTKKSGQPRALYDILKDYTVDTKRKKKNKDDEDGDPFSVILSVKNKGKRKKKKSKHWYV